jgi:hypothetical protein
MSDCVCRVISAIAGSVKYHNQYFESIWKSTDKCLLQGTGSPESPVAWHIFVFRYQTNRSRS